jgi:hypothetical protein
VKAEAAEQDACDGEYNEEIGKDNENEERGKI